MELLRQLQAQKMRQDAHIEQRHEEYAKLKLQQEELTREKKEKECTESKKGDDDPSTENARTNTNANMNVNHDQHQTSDKQAKKATEPVVDVQRSSSMELLKSMKMRLAQSVEKCERTQMLLEQVLMFVEECEERIPGHILELFDELDKHKRAGFGRGITALIAEIDVQSEREDPEIIDLINRYEKLKSQLPRLTQSRNNARSHKRALEKRIEKLQEKLNLTISKE